MDEDEPPTMLVTQRSRQKAVRLVPTLTVLEGPGLGAFFVLRDGVEEHRIGRSEAVEVHIPSPSVSRVHATARLTREGDRPKVQLLDAGSTNGLHVNGTPVGDVFLISGDKIRLGDVLLRFDWMPEEESHYHSDVSERIRKASRDGLTGLLTRGFLEQRLPDLLEELDASGTSMALVMMDVDHFKAVNDQHGHLVGDEVLRKVAATIDRLLGPEDLGVRYGGEEFLFLLTGPTEEQACQSAEHWRTAVEQRDWSAVRADLSVTASFGVAMRRRREPLEPWLERADQALYAAKRSGRNRVELAGSADPAEDSFLVTLRRANTEDSG